MWFRNKIRRVPIISALALIASCFIPAHAQHDSGAGWATVEATNDDLGLSAILDVALDEERPVIAIFSLQSNADEPKRIWGRLRHSDFAKNISVRQGDVVWKSPERLPIEIPRLAPGEVERVPDSWVLTPGESLSWRYTIEELVDDYESFANIEDLRRMAIRAALIYGVGRESTPHTEARYGVITLNWRFSR